MRWVGAAVFNVLCVHCNFFSGWRWCVLALGVSVLVPVVVLGWWMEGGSLGFRDPPVGSFPLLVLSLLLPR